MRKRKENPLTEDKSEEKCICFTLRQKRCNLLLAENKIVPEVAAEFGISHRQVYDIWKHRDKWIRTANNHEEDCIVCRDKRKEEDHKFTGRFSCI